MSLNKAPALLILLILFSCSTYTKEESTLVINESQLFYEMTVPASNLILKIQKGNLKKEIVRESKSYRYFQFTDEDTKLIVSGWFEPESLFPGIKKAWERNLYIWKRNGLPEPRLWSFSEFGEWEIISYEVYVDGCYNPHINAHLVKDGTWIELHLSYNCSEIGYHNRLLSFLDSIKVESKQNN